MTMVMADLRDMDDSEKLDLVRAKLSKPVSTYLEAMIVLEELDKIVEA